MRLSQIALALTNNGGGGLFPGSSLSLDFVNGNNTLDSRITFTRSSNAWYFNSAGVLTQATTNTPRFDYDPVTLAPRGLLIEEQRTNLLLYSAQLDVSAIWVDADASTCIVTSNSDTAPDGTLSADTLTDNSATNRVGRVQNVTVPNDTATRSASVFVKKTSGATSFPGFQMQYNTGGTALTGGVTINTNTGVLIDRTGLAPTSKQITNCGLYWRVDIQVANNGTGNTVCSTFYYPAVNSDASGTWGSTTTGSSVVWGFQNEAGSFATSYIPTTTASATRAADVAVMTGTNFSSWYNATEGTLFTDFSFAAVYATAPSAGFSVDDGTANNLIILRTNTAHTQYGATATINTTNLTNVNSVAIGSTSANTSLKEAIAYKSGDSMLCGAGTLGTVSTTTFSGSAFTAARIGNNFANNQPLNGWVRRIAYYPRRLANAELQGITS